MIAQKVAIQGHAGFATEDRVTTDRGVRVQLMYGKRSGVSQVSRALCELANSNGFVGSEAEGWSLIVWYRTPGNLGEQ